MQNNNLPIAQVRRHGACHFCVRRGWDDDHCHIATIKRLFHVRCDQRKLTETARTGFARFQFDAATLPYGFDVFGSAIVERRLKTHQGQMRCHRLPAIPGAMTV